MGSTRSSWPAERGDSGFLAGFPGLVPGSAGARRGSTCQRPQRAAQGRTTLRPARPGVSSAGRESATHRPRSGSPSLPPSRRRSAVHRGAARQPVVSQGRGRRCLTPGHCVAAEPSKGASCVGCAAKPRANLPHPSLREPTSRSSGGSVNGVMLETCRSMWDNVVVIFAPEGQHNYFREVLRETPRWRSENLRFVDPNWGLERMIGALSEISEVSPFPR